MHWEWSELWVSLGILAGFLMFGALLNTLQDIRQSLRNIEELLEPKRDYEVEAGLPLGDGRED
jgi:hypothetical protein